jgi:hypothetical protein
MTSKDKGKTFRRALTDIRQNVCAAGMSDCGLYQTVCTTGGIFVSSDFGETFSQKIACAYTKEILRMSGSGQYQLYGRYISDDFGETWQLNVCKSMWQQGRSLKIPVKTHITAISERGQYQLSVDECVYTSSDYGKTKTKAFETRCDYENSPCIGAMSKDGRVQIATWPDHPIYKSEDYGITWKEHSIQKSWSCGAVSGDGKIVLLGELGGSVYMYE